MSSVDQRVVEMKFNSSAFSKGIADTLAALTKLQNALKLDGAGKGAKAASDSIDALGLKAGGLGGKVTGAAAEAGRGLDQLGQKAGFVGSQFTAMQAVAFGALASIGAKALQVGEMVGSALTVAPLMSGLKEYELNLNSIQTILANTKVAGVGLTEVNAALDELNDYSDRTIYNFGQMANAIGLFTASGVDLDRSVGSIKGIANLAAMSGSSAEQAAGLYRQLSQAISAGRVSLQDWNSVMTAGMGGTVFQRALAQTGVAMGTISEGALKLEGPMQNVMISGKSFRDSIDATQGPSWLTSDVLVATLEQFTGDLTDAELAAQGFSGAQIAAIQDTARTASLAAQEVKTLSQAFDIAQETAGSGWSQTWRLIFGDFEEAKTTFTEFSNWMNGFIKTAAESRNAVLQGWKNLGGRDVMLEGFRNAGTALLGVLRPIGEAFRTIFPKTTPGELFRFTQAFANFTKSLIPTQETADNLRRTFAGLFAVLGIVWDFVKAGASFLLRLFGVITEGSGSILAFTGNIGDFLVKLHEAITEGELFSRFFDGLAGFIEKPIIAIKALIGWFTSLFSSASSAGATESVDQLTDAMGQLGNMVERIGRAWAAFSDWVSELWEKAQPGVDAIKEAFEDLIDSLVSALSNITLGDILAGIATGSFVAAVAAIKKFFDELDIGKFFGGGEEGE